MTSPSPQGSPIAQSRLETSLPMMLHDLVIGKLPEADEDSPQSAESVGTRVADVDMKARLFELRRSGVDASSAFPLGNEDVTAPAPPRRTTGFVLTPRHASMLFIEPTYFVVFPNVYVFEKHRIVCQVDEAGRFHEVKSLEPNPPKPETVFYIDDIPYWFDHQNRIWFRFAGQWHLEILHSDVTSARQELAHYESGNL